MPDMMSLVGCYGEEFQAILRSLDFRMQKRKVKRPASPPAPAAAEATAEATPEMAEAGTEAAVEETVAQTEVPPPPEPVAEVPGPMEEPAADTAPAMAEATEAMAPAAEAQAAPVVEAPAIDAVVEVPAAEAPADEIEIEIWWPKDTGPFRRERLLYRQGARRSFGRDVRWLARRCDFGRQYPRLSTASTAGRRRSELQGGTRGCERRAINAHRQSSLWRSE